MAHVVRLRCKRVTYRPNKEAVFIRSLFLLLFGRWLLSPIVFVCLTKTIVFYPKEYPASYGSCCSPTMQASHVSPKKRDCFIRSLFLLLFGDYNIFYQQFWLFAKNEYYTFCIYKSISASVVNSVVATRILLSQSFSPPIMPFDLSFVKNSSAFFTSMTNSLK